jgi:zinc protease
MDLIHQFTMENGLKVVLEENRNAPVVALQIWVKIGSGDEKEEEAGICHFIEHMLFKGTEKRKAGEIGKEIESLGGSINAYTSYDETVYDITIASRYAEIGIDVLADAMLHSTFDPVELEREREVVLEEVRMRKDDPSSILSDQTMATLYQHHPYRRPIIGYEKTIRSMTRDQMISFFKRWYVPNHMVFIGVGDFDPLEIEKKVRAAFGEFKSSSGNLPLRKKEPEPVAFRSSISYGDFKDMYLKIAIPTTAAKDEDTQAVNAISRILGGGEASRLVQKVKLEKGLVHSIWASSYTLKDPGPFIIGAILPPENVEKVIEAIGEEISRLGREGVTSEELQRLKVNVESHLIYSREIVQWRAGRLGYYEALFDDIQFEKEDTRKISLLQSEDIQRIVKKYFKTSRWVVNLLVPSEKTKEAKDLPLKKIVEKANLNESIAREKRSPIFRTVLDNGIRLVVKENRSIPTVSIQVAFLGGVRFEEETQNGVNHFMADMITRGTNKQTNLQIAKKVERMAGSLSGFSGYNSFGLSFEFLSQHFDEAFALLTEIIKEPAFDPEEMEKRRRLIIASIKRQEDYPGRFVFELFRKVLYEKHPYRMDTLGTLESVQRLTQKDLKEYYRRIVVPENMVFTFVGDVDTQQVIAAVKGGLGDLKKGNFAPPALPQELPLQKIKRIEVTKKKEQAYFVLGFLGTTFHHRDRYAMEVLDAALSGMGGRLFRLLRDEESLAYHLAFMASPSLDKGFIGVYMGTHPDKLEKAIKRVLEELKKLKEEGLTEDEVERAKKYLIGNFEIGLQGNYAQAYEISFAELYGFGYDHLKNYPREIEKVSREEVQMVAQTYINLEAYAIAIIRPPVGEEE